MSETALILLFQFFGSILSTITEISNISMATRSVCNSIKAHDKSASFIIYMSIMQLKIVIVYGNDTYIINDVSYIQNYKNLPIVHQYKTITIFSIMSHKLLY